MGSVLHYLDESALRRHASAVRRRGVPIAGSVVPAVGRRLRHALPIANYDRLLPLTPAQLREWAVLDTFDMLAPTHDHPQRVETLRAWFDRAGLVDAEVFRDGLVIGRGRQPGAAPL